MLERPWPRRGAQVLLMAAVLQTAGCVYFNGIYNAKEAAQRGDAQLRQGAETDAASFFQLSAAKAETVLVRHPQSSWRSRALYLAGRGEAWSGQCEAATSRLTEYLASEGIELSSAKEPAVVVIGAFVLMLSFSRIGMPWSGPRTRRALRSASSASAIFSASGFSSMTERSAGPERSSRLMRSR